MPYFAYGRDPKTDEPMRRIYCEHSAEDEARAHAQAQGMRVTSVVPCSEQDKPGAIVAGASPVSAATVLDGPTPVSTGGAPRDVIDGITRYMRIVGIFLVISAAITFVAALVAGRAAAALEGLVELVVAILTIRTAGRFGRVGSRAGGDAGSMTEALESLRSLYLFQAIVIAAAVVIIGLVVVGALLMRAV